jgi:hypothetical protein
MIMIIKIEKKKINKYILKHLIFSHNSFHPSISPSVCGVGMRDH